MPCHRCGSIVGVTDTVCPVCGNSLTDPRYSTKPIPYRSGYTVPDVPPATGGQAPQRQTQPNYHPFPAAPAPPPPMPQYQMSSDTYFLYVNNTKSGPYTVNQMKSMWQAGSINLGTHYWQPGMADWQPLAQIRHFIESPPPLYGNQIIVNQMNSAPMMSPVLPVPVYNRKDRASFVLLGIFLGALGIHNFYAGYSGRAIAQLLLTLCLSWLFGLGAIISFCWAIVEVIVVDTDSNGVRMS